MKPALVMVWLIFVGLILRVTSARGDSTTPMSRTLPLFTIGKSQNKNQVLFKIVQKNSGASVQVPGTDGISVSSFSSDYSFLM